MSELPEGWSTIKLTRVYELNPAKPKSNELSSDLPVTFVPMAAVDAELGAITNPTIRVYSAVAKGFTSFQENDVIMAKITPCMENGKAAIARGLSNGFGFGSNEFHVFRSSGAVLPEYIFHFIRQESFRKLAEANMTGSVGQKRVPASFLNECGFPLPPLAEQQGIVRRVEALFQLADQLEARYQRAKAQVDKLPQAILAKAFRGELVPTEAELARRDGRNYESAAVLLERLRQTRATPAVKPSPRKMKKAAAKESRLLSE